MVCIGICNYGSFCGNYSFFNWALCTVVTFGDSKYIKVGKLFKGGNYSRAETIRGNINKCAMKWKSHEIV